MTSIQSKKILIVDDEPMICEILSDLFTADGATTKYSLNATEALQLLAKEHFDILISDIRMPIKDGLTLLKEIPTDIKQRLLIYFCSGFSDISEAQAQVLGAQCIFLKPFNYNNILKRIHEDLRLLRSAR